MPTQTFDVKVAANGRMVLPASVCSALGVLASGVPPYVAREMIDELKLTVIPHDASAAWASAQLGPFATPACSSET